MNSITKFKFTIFYKAYKVLPRDIPRDRITTNCTYVALEAFSKLSTRLIEQYDLFKFRY